MGKVSLVLGLVHNDHIHSPKSITAEILALLKDNVFRRYVFARLVGILLK